MSNTKLAFQEIILRQFFLLSLILTSEVILFKNIRKIITSSRYIETADYHQVLNQLHLNGSDGLKVSADVRPSGLR